jgi:hypothetical protein
MSTLASGKIAEVLFENALETYEDQTMLVDKTDVFTPNPGTMQNSGNVIWRPVQQHAPVIEGWDLAGLEQEIIEETYPAILGLPKNDFVQQRIDNLRDSTFWERRGKQAGKQQATELNTGLAALIKNSGSLYYRSNDTSGFDFIAEGQAIMNERQGAHTNRCYVLNDRDTKKFAQDLASRETIKGRPADAWATGQIGSNVAEFDVFTGSFCPLLTGGAAVSTTTTAAASFAPEGGTVDASTSVVTNVDYRTATIGVTASASYSVGDKVTIDNSAVPIESIGLSDKNSTGQAMTFTIVAKPTSTSLTIFPKPIAADDGALTTTELAYANVDTTITSGATVERINSDASARTNLFWDRDAIEVLGGDVPMDLMAQFDGKKVISETMSNGLNMYMIYDSELEGLTLRYRLFTWYGLTMKDPSRAGVSITY